jgi:hypothetical protein
MLRTTPWASLLRAVERPDASGRTAGSSADRCRLHVTAAPDRIVIACHAPRGAGAASALGLAERVAVLIRDCGFGSRSFGTPSIELDGRHPDGFRAVVTLPIRRDAG